MGVVLHATAFYAFCVLHVRNSQYLHVNIVLHVSFTTPSQTPTTRESQCTKGAIRGRVRVPCTMAHFPAPEQILFLLTEANEIDSCVQAYIEQFCPLNVKTYLYISAVPTAQFKLYKLVAACWKFLRWL